MNQSGKLSNNTTRGQLNVKKKCFIPWSRSRLKIMWSFETGSPAPSLARPLILHARAESVNVNDVNVVNDVIGAYSRDVSLFLRRFPSIIPTNRHRVSPEFIT